MEVGKSETLTLGNIDSGIDVNEVGRAAVGLIACDGSMGMCPVSPLCREVLKEEFSYRLTIIAYEEFMVRGLIVKKGVLVLFEVITPASLEL